MKLWRSCRRQRTLECCPSSRRFKGLGSYSPFMIYERTVEWVLVTAASVPLSENSTFQKIARNLNLRIMSLKGRSAGLLPLPYHAGKDRRLWAVQSGVSRLSSQGLKMHFLSWDGGVRSTLLCCTVQVKRFRRFHLPNKKKSLYGLLY